MPEVTGDEVEVKDEVRQVSYVAMACNVYTDSVAREAGVNREDVGVE